jgi:hypothetical protein
MLPVNQGSVPNVPKSLKPAGVEDDKFYFLGDPDGSVDNVCAV